MRLLVRRGTHKSKPYAGGPIALMLGNNFEVNKEELVILITSPLYMSSSTIIPKERKDLFW